jgi:hypothetical protein
MVQKALQKNILPQSTKSKEIKHKLLYTFHIIQTTNKYEKSLPHFSFILWMWHWQRQIQHYVISLWWWLQWKWQNKEYLSLWLLNTTPVANTDNENDNGNSNGSYENSPVHTLSWLMTTRGLSRPVLMLSPGSIRVLKSIEHQSLKANWLCTLTHPTPWFMLLHPPSRVTWRFILTSRVWSFSTKIT